MSSIKVDFYVTGCVPYTGSFLEGAKLVTGTVDRIVSRRDLDEILQTAGFYRIDPTDRSTLDIIIGLEEDCGDVEILVYRTEGYRLLNFAFTERLSAIADALHDHELSTSPEPTFGDVGHYCSIV